MSIHLAHAGFQVNCRQRMQKIMPFAGLFKWFRQDALRITPLRLCVGGLVIIAGLIYLPFLRNPLVFDDIHVIQGANFLDDIFEFRFAPRWLPYATLGHTYALTDGSIAAMRIGSLILHVANAIAVFVLLREICLASGNSGLQAFDNETRALIVAFTAAVVFVAHPMAVYGAGYLVQRTTLMSTLFMLCMLIAYLRWLISGRTVLWIWSALWYFLSVFSKEHSVMAPAIALLLTPLFQRPSWLLLRRLLLPFTAYAAIAALVIFKIKGVLGVAYEADALAMLTALSVPVDGPLQNIYALSVITQSLLFFKYLILWIFPNVAWVSIDMREAFSVSLFAWPYWAGALAFLLYLIIALVMLFRRGCIGVAGWVLLYPWLMFATELSSVRVQETLVLYRAYLWFPVFGALLGLLLYRQGKRVTLVAVFALVSVLVPLSWNRLHSMSDALLLWQDAAMLLRRGDEPGAGRIYYNRGLALSAKGRKLEAIEDIDRVLTLHPQLAPVYYAKAVVNFDLKRYSDALENLNDYIKLDTKNAAVYLARATVLNRLGREMDALPDLRKSCEMKAVIACYALQQGRSEGGYSRR